MLNIRKSICFASGKLYISPELSESSEKKLLHISDTPSCFYSDLKRLICRLRPEYIVHTGDLADDIKLALRPNLIYEYEKEIKRLANMLESSGAVIILSLGNHDDIDVVSKHFKNSRIIAGAETISVEKMSFRISHLPEGIIKEPALHNLFGHDLTLKDGCIDNKWYHNGISYINIIGLETGDCMSLCYPTGVDNSRQGMRKIGL